MRTNTVISLVSLSDFLSAANAGSVHIPRPVHSATAAKLYDILNARRLQAYVCNVFRGEELCYVFVGRPAYKWLSDGQASWWQCPVVFVLRGLDDLSVKRIYPFDTGAFSQRFPDYITVFSRDDFSLGADTTQIGRLIAAFYGSTERYLKAQTKTLAEISSEVALTPRHMQIQALLQLYSEPAPRDFDDRAKTVEVQIGGDIEITNDKLLGVVLPQTFLNDPEVVAYFSDLGCQVRTYPIYPINVAAYYALIYKEVEVILRKSEI